MPDKVPIISDSSYNELHFSSLAPIHIQIILAMPDAKVFNRQFMPNPAVVVPYIHYLSLSKTALIWSEYQKPKPNLLSAPLNNSIYTRPRTKYNGFWAFVVARVNCNNK